MLHGLVPLGILDRKQLRGLGGTYRHLHLWMWIANWNLRLDLLCLGWLHET